MKFRRRAQIMKLHLCPEAKQGTISAFAQGSGKLDEKPDRDGGHQPRNCGTILVTGSLELYSPNDK